MQTVASIVNVLFSKAGPKWLFRIFVLCIARELLLCLRPFGYQVPLTQLSMIAGSPQVSVA